MGNCRAGSLQHTFIWICLCLYLICILHQWILKQRRQFMYINTVSEWNSLLVNSSCSSKHLQTAGFFFFFFSVFTSMTLYCPWQQHGPKSNKQKRLCSWSVSGWSGVCWCLRSCLSLTDFTSSQRVMLNKAPIHNNNKRQRWHRCRHSQTPVHCKTNCQECQSQFLIV